MRHDEVTLSGFNAESNYFEICMQSMYPDMPIYKIGSNDGAVPEFDPKNVFRHASSIDEMTFFEPGQDATWTVQFSRRLKFSEMADFLEGCLDEASWKEYSPA